MNQEEKEEPHCELENDFLNDDLSLIIECNTFDPAKQMQRIRKYAGMNRKEFSEWLNIPYRTMTDWELGNRTMPVYLLELIVYKVNPAGAQLAPFLIQKAGAQGGQHTHAPVVGGGAA